MKKVKWISNVPSPYRMDFFNKLGKYVDLTVVFEAETVSSLNNTWFQRKRVENFTAIFLKKGKIEEKKINFRIIKQISSKVDYLVFTNYSYLTEMLGIIYAKLRKIPYVLEIDGGIVQSSENEWKFKLKKFLISGASLYLSTSKQSDAFLMHYGADIKRIKRYHFSSFDVDSIEVIDDKNKCLIKRELGVNETKMILSVGQFIYRKGFDWMIESLHKIDKNIGIYIIGGKPTKEYLSLKEKYKMDNLHFIDFLGEEKIFEWYKAADLFVFPTRFDIWGLVVNEAMSKGIPVITTNQCVAGTELIKNGYNGYLCDVEDTEDLFNKVEHFFSKNNLDVEKMRLNVLNVIKHYTISQMVKDHLEVFGITREG